jgi:hypothetical protein
MAQPDRPAGFAAQAGGSKPQASSLPQQREGPAGLEAMLEQPQTGGPPGATGTTPASRELPGNLERGMIFACLLQAPQFQNEE